MKLATFYNHKSLKTNESKSTTLITKRFGAGSLFAETLPFN